MDVLFLCTGNYYRSRFAEALLADAAASAALPLTVASRGLWRGENRNPGPLSVHTARALAALGIVYEGAGRHPLPVTTAELAAARWAIGLYEAEHRPLVEARFPPALAAKVTYWQVPDVYEWPPERALQAIREEVDTLLASLRSATILRDS